MLHQPFNHNKLLMRMTLAISNENMCLQFTKNVSSFITSDIFVPIQSRVTTKSQPLLSYYITYKSVF